MWCSPIKTLRITAGLKAYELVAAAQINPSRLSQLKNLHVEPNPNERERTALARALGISEKELFPEAVTPHGSNR